MSLRNLLLYLKFKWNSLWLSCVWTHHVPSSKRGSGKLEFFFYIQRYPSTKISKHSKKSLKPFLSVLHFCFSEVPSAKLCAWQSSSPLLLLLVILPLAVTELSGNNQLPATLPCSPDSQLWIRALTFISRAPSLLKKEDLSEEIQSMSLL